jgi:hypothetical protein
MTDDLFAADDNNTALSPEEQLDLIPSLSTLHSDAAKTSAMLGHKANDQVLFDSYRSLGRKKDGEAYFGILP